LGLKRMAQIYTESGTAKEGVTLDADVLHVV